MGLSLIIKRDHGDEKYEFAHLDLPNLICALYNHQVVKKEKRTLSLPEAQRLIQSYDGSKQIRLDRVRNEHRHARSLGLMLEGTWSEDGFNPSKIIIQEEDFLKGGIRGKVRVRDKFKKDVKSLDDFFETLKLMNEALAPVPQATPYEKRHAELDRLSSQSLSEVPIQVSSSAPSSSVATEERKSLSHLSDSEVAVAHSSETGEFRFSELDAVSEASENSQAKESSRASREQLLKQLPPSINHSDEPEHLTPVLKKGTSSLSDSLWSSSEDQAASWPPKNGTAALLKQVGHKPSSQASVKLQNDKSKGLLHHLVLPSVMAVLTYGAVRMATAARWLAVASVGSAAMMWAAGAFVATGLFQFMRDRYKKSSFENVHAHGNTVSELQDKLASLGDVEWASIKDGFQAQNSIVSQFKSCFCRRDYQQGYYAGMHLAEHQPGFDLNEVDVKRAVKPVQ